MFARHEQFTGQIDASAEDVFARLDDQTRLAGHMNKRSWRMGWGTMELTLDAQRGRTVGSHIGLHGRILGIRLGLDEVVVDRVPPTSKTWETVGEPRLLVIGAYRMGFVITSAQGSVQLLVTIDYDIPSHGLSRLFGRLLGRTYAQWCTRQMVHDAQVAFSGNR
jgi:hypothetical protein